MPQVTCCVPSLSPLPVGRGWRDRQLGAPTDLLPFGEYLEKSLPNVRAFIFEGFLAHCLRVSLVSWSKRFKYWKCVFFLITEKHKHSLFFLVLYTLEAKQHDKLCVSNGPYNQTLDISPKAGSHPHVTPTPQVCSAKETGGSRDLAVPFLSFPWKRDGLFLICVASLYSVENEDLCKSHFLCKHIQC